MTSWGRRQDAALAARLFSATARPRNSSGGVVRMLRSNGRLRIWFKDYREPPAKTGGFGARKSQCSPGTQIGVASSHSRITIMQGGDCHAFQARYLNPRGRRIVWSDGDRIGPDAAARSRRVE